MSVNWKVPCARCTGPPRSNSQYQSANTMTLVAQMAAPDASSGTALLASPLMIRRMSSTAESALAALIRKISTMLASRTACERRSMRTGLATISPISSAVSSAGSR